MSSRRWPMFLAALLLSTSLSLHTAGAQEARVRASLVDDGQVWVGQRVTLVVELLAPGYFASAASFEIPDPAGVLLMPPQGHPLVSNETIDGTQYSVQRHELLAWPMRAGDQTIPAVTARFRFKRSPLDTDEVQASLTTDPMRFTVALPPGAEGLGTVISARNLEVRDSWDPEPGGGEIKAGAAFTRTVTFTAPDLPGMVFPPFPAGDIEGLGIYAKQHLQDSENRGALTGMRRDEITYVCQRPGQYTIPALKLTWFDLDANELRTEVLAAQTLSVVANPAMAAADAGQATAAPGRWMWAKLAGVLTFVTLAYLAIRLALRKERLRRRVDRLVDRCVDRCVAPFRAVHLEPLNPTASSQTTDP